MNDLTNTRSQIVPLGKIQNLLDNDDLSLYEAMTQLEKAFELAYLHDDSQQEFKLNLSSYNDEF